MILVTSKRQEFAVHESVDTGLDPFDERESRLRRPTCQERREGQEQLLDQPGGGERAECVRTSFEQDQLVAAFPKRAQNDTPGQSQSPMPTVPPQPLPAPASEVATRRSSTSGSPPARRALGAVRRSPRSRSGSLAPGAQDVPEGAGARRRAKRSRGERGLETTCR